MPHYHFSEAATVNKKSNIDIYLRSNSGKVATPYFGHEFDESKFKIQIDLSITLKNPYEEHYDYDIKEYYFDEDINIDIEYDILPEYECISIGSTNNGCINKTETRFQTTVGSSGDLRIYFVRNIPNSEELNKWKRKRFTGFSVSWACGNCNGELSSYNTFAKFDKNKLFIKIANLLHGGTSPAIIWTVIQSKLTLWQVEFKRMNKLDKVTYDNIFQNVILANLNLTSEPSSWNIFSENITEETLEAAARILLYLDTPSQKHWETLLDMYLDFVDNLSLSRLIGTRYYAEDVKIRSKNDSFQIHLLAFHKCLNLKLKC